MGSQFYRLSARYAADDSRTRLSPDAASSGAARHGRDSRHDRESAPLSRNRSLGQDMEPTLSNLKPPRGSRHRKVRVGRGMGSKLGKTSGKGNKGQKSRKGYSRRAGFEGGQMPLRRRIPKRGFHNPTRVEYAVVNVESLNIFPAGTNVTRELLLASGLIRQVQF